MIDFIKRLFGRYGFFKREQAFTYSYPAISIWHEEAFYTAERRRNERLAQIARERDALKEKLAKAIKDKKARQPIYKALRALSSEELAIEQGKEWVR